MAGLGSLGPKYTKLNRNPTSLTNRGLNHGSAALSYSEKVLIRFSPLLLAQSLPRKRFLGTAFLAGLHVEAVLLDFLNDVFLLHLALETAQGIFQRLTFLDNDFGHVYIHPQSGSDWLHAAPLLGTDAAPIHYRMPAIARSPMPPATTNFEFPQSSVKMRAPWTIFTLRTICRSGVTLMR